MKEITTILFDFDGTIMDTNELIIQSWQHTFRTVEGKERSVESIIETFGEPLYVTMKKVLPGIDVEEGVSIYRNYLTKHYTEMISPFPGMPELLETLKRLGLRNGLVTSRTKESTFRGLDHFGLTSFFDSVVTCDDTDRHKPDPEPLLIAMRELAVLPHQCLMIGDSMFDILCARNAGVRSVLVGWQMAVTEEDLQGENAPDFQMETPEALVALLTQE